MNSTNSFWSIASTLAGDPPAVKDVWQPSFRRQNFSDGTAKSGIGNLHSLMKKSDLWAWSYHPILRHHVLLPFLAQVERIIATIHDEKEIVNSLRMLFEDYKSIFDDSLLDLEDQDFVKLARNCKIQIMWIKEYPIELYNAHLARWNIHQRVQALIPEAVENIRRLESWARIFRWENPESFVTYLSEKWTLEERVTYEVAQIIAWDLDDFTKARNAYDLIDQLSTLNPFLKRVKGRFIGFVSKKDWFIPFEVPSKNPWSSKSDTSPEVKVDPRLKDILVRLKKKGNNSYKNALRTDIINTIAELKALDPTTPEILGYIKRFSLLNAWMKATRVSKKKAYSTWSPIGQHLWETK